ncbi:OLC1v1036935C1 [Oldenlandia corymbosa var. corymbosa]|uniref:OLC1v1036935C1 n=1 Tax=Oldenlandia corymbosa var. corymbosa TaxID=529605 RepID=A0AAV1CZP6_OLDCO|nr:OLC1v1036935C1 [Oldenlandia corymbosa var. corymbosa]
MFASTRIRNFGVFQTTSRRQHIYQYLLMVSCRHFESLRTKILVRSTRDEECTDKDHNNKPNSEKLYPRNSNHMESQVYETQLEQNKPEKEASITGEDGRSLKKRQWVVMTGMIKFFCLWKSA